MKVYKNKKTAKLIGVKFDNFCNSMTTITSDGDIGTVATVKFVPRDRKVSGDFNADPDFVKEYDFDMRQIFAGMLGVCGADMTARFKMEYSVFLPPLGFRAGFTCFKKLPMAGSFCVNSFYSSTLSLRSSPLKMVAKSDR